MSGERYPDQPEPRPVTPQQAQLIAGLMPLSPLLLAGISYFIVSQAQAEGQTPNDIGPLLFLLLCAAASGLVASFVLKRIIAAQAAPGPEGLQMRFQATLIAVALAEAPAVIGVILSFFTFDFTIPGILFGAAVGFGYFHFPTQRWLLGETA